MGFSLEFDANMSGEETEMLMNAIIHNSKNIRSLIEKGVDINRICRNGYTPLYMACLKGDIEVVKVLIKGGADPNLPSKEGRTPLYIAVFIGWTHREIARYLVVNGAGIIKN